MYWSNTEDAPFGPPPVITLDKVKLKFIVPERANTNVIPIMSFINGSVIENILRTGPAPSIVAAS